jgi:hypothetical protein
MEPMASLFSCYYRSSLAGRNLCDHDWIGRNWNNKLWKIRSRKGKEFTDSIVFYTYKAWRPSSKGSKSFDDFFGLHFLPAVWIKDNGGQDLKDIGDILNDQWAAHNATPQAAPGQSAASPLTVVRLEKVSTDPDAPHEIQLVIATTKNLPDLNSVVVHCDGDLAAWSWTSPDQNTIKNSISGHNFQFNFSSLHYGLTPRFDPAHPLVFLVWSKQSITCTKVETF